MSHSPNKSDSFSGVVTPSLTKHGSTDEDVVVRRQIQRREVYKGGDRRIRTVDRNSLRPGIFDRYDFPDGNIVAKSAPGSGRSSPTDFLSLSLAAPKAWTPISGMSNPPIEAKVVILGAQGKNCLLLYYN